ncbi:hypothetical protein DWG18_02440 [Lysobacter sp. TY2-98]|uniref:hypothetical protein n=1 Tax=Lysobacter sp. TY2-98 TaxID=2290922 RepID=UPI000E20107E|nr:hypothetical protein [Lysobacter sp. TY2-98]AXK71258.1 hypothetical protein DWG18_02440 [Lysobacter sp. TY2-98]
MKNIIATAILALVLFGAAPTVSAAESPEEVERGYVEAVRTKGMTAVPEFIHPDELARFQSMLLPVLSGETPAAKNLRAAFFGPSASAQSVQTMSPVEFMRALMGFAEGQMKAMNVKVGDSQILGSVKEGEVVHLVTRNTAGAGSLQVTQLEVVSLKPYQNTWRLLLSGKLEGMAQALKAQAAPPSP